MSEVTKPIRVFLADDHKVLRAGLKALLDAEVDMEVVGEAATGEEALDRAPLTRPDVLIMDLEMPGMGGLEATRVLAAQNIRVLVLTAFTEDEYLLQVLEAGGSGFVRKTRAEHDLTEAIRAVARGELFLYPSATRLLLQGYREKSTKSQPDMLDQLSERERDVMIFTAKGYSSTEIGKKLFISSKTVDTYRARIMEKLGLKHRSELVQEALKAGLLKAE